MLKLLIGYSAVIFGIHLIRCKAFNRYEAATFEFCLTSSLFLYLNMWLRGFSILSLIIFGVFLFGFWLISFYQHKFYNILQNQIRTLFTRLSEKMPEDKQACAKDYLAFLSSRAIVPSFTRFIEESKIFNKSGGFFSLIKSIMRRKRFLKDKYVMRERMADTVNLLGPYGVDVPELENGRVHANDLALGYSDEKKGLAAVDIIGFGALIFGFLLLAFGHLIKGLPDAFYTEISIYSPVLFVLSILAFIVINQVLRRYAFDRYESIGFEASVVALMLVSFKIMIKEDFDAADFIVLGCLLVVFLLMAAVQRYYDGMLNKKAARKLAEVKASIPIRDEKGLCEEARIKRRCIDNLIKLCDWAVVPIFTFLPAKNKKGELRRAYYAPDKMCRLIKEIVPESEVAQNLTMEDFCITEKERRTGIAVFTVFGFGSIVAAIALFLTSVI